MSINNINFFIILFFIILFFFIFNFNSNIQSLIISELFWITLYSLNLILSFYFNNYNLLSLTIFFLIFSAVEISVGIVLIFFQKIILNNTSTLHNKNNFNLSKIFNFRLLNIKKYKI